jgi:hypothetical protein
MAFKILPDGDAMGNNPIRAAKEGQSVSLRKAKRVPDGGVFASS